MTRPTLVVRRLGRVPYARGLELQAELVAARQAGHVPDQLLLLEHDPVFTLGRNAKQENVLFPAEAGMELADLSRVIQGVATGIGFIGAGAILKRAERDEIQGLTTAAGLWLTAAIGLAAGAGQLWTPVVCAILAWIILRVLTRLEHHPSGRDA